MYLRPNNSLSKKISDRNSVLNVSVNVIEGRQMLTTVKPTDRPQWH